MKSLILSASLGVAALGFIATPAYAADSERSTALRLQKMLDTLEARSAGSPHARRTLAALVASMMRDLDEDDFDEDDIDERQARMHLRYCESRHDANRDRMEPSFEACMASHLERLPAARVRKTGRQDHGRPVITTIKRNGTNTIYRRTIGTGHKMAVRQRGSGNRVAIVQSD